MPTTFKDRLRDSWRILAKEIAAFGAVGAVGLVIDIGLYNVFFDDGQVIAKTISTTVACAVTYVGNRYLSFSHRARNNLGREAGIFVLINAIALVFSLAVIAFFEYPLHYKHDHVVMNIAGILATAVGTVFRFWTYKRFVFTETETVRLEPVVAVAD